ncbi:MAG: hypothetical protein RLZ04_404, partial [Actinomycetota bacterium]
MTSAASDEGPERPDPDPVPDPADDPFALLGVALTASAAELAVARRRLARSLHPDAGGDAVAMQRLNAAYELALAVVRAVEEAGPVEEPEPEPAPEPAPVVADPRVTSRRLPGFGRPPRGRVDRDAPSFTIEALPAEAFEALLIVVSWSGELLVDDPPYMMEVFLQEPEPCWCRIDLLPEAGGSTV